MNTAEFCKNLFKKNRVSSRQCRECVYYIENYKDDYTLRHFGYGEIKYRPACRFNNNYTFVSHNPARLCNYYEKKGT